VYIAGGSIDVYRVIGRDGVIDSVVVSPTALLQDVVYHREPDHHRPRHDHQGIEAKNMCRTYLSAKPSGR